MATPQTSLLSSLPALLRLGIVQAWLAVGSGSPILTCMELRPPITSAIFQRRCRRAVQMSRACMFSSAVGGFAAVITFSLMSVGPSGISVACGPAFHLICISPGRLVHPCWVCVYPVSSCRCWVMVHQRLVHSGEDIAGCRAVVNRPAMPRIGRHRKLRRTAPCDRSR